MLKINKKLISLALAGTLALAPLNTLADIYLTSDYEISNSNVNVRISDNIDSKRIGGIKKGTKVERIFVSDKNWDLIRYNNTLGYVSHEYMIPLEKEEYTYVDHVEYKDTIYTNSKVNLRLGPDKSNKVIGSIPKNTELTSIAVTENNWYLVSYNGKLGYVSGDYIISAKKLLKEAFNVSYYGNLDVCKIGYVNKNLYLLDGSFNETSYLDKYQTIEILCEINGYYLVKNASDIGLILKDDVKLLNDVFVVIDLSDQKLKLYNENEVILETKVVTGTLETPTREGCFKIYSKEYDRDLVGEDYCRHVNYWMPFDGGIGLHDAEWRGNSFGGKIYQNHGSHGCVNMPLDITPKIDENVKVGTKVLVKK